MSRSVPDANRSVITNSPWTAAPDLFSYYSPLPTSLEYGLNDLARNPRYGRSIRLYGKMLAKYFAPEIIADLCEKVVDAPGAFEVDLPFYIEAGSSSD